MSNTKKSILLIDGNALMHRSYHGIAKGFMPILDGKPVGMVYGFTATLLNAIEYFHPHVMAVTFDTKEKTFRHEMDEAYKAQREKAPDDFYSQIPLVYEMLEAFHIPTLTQPGYESDDLIGTIAKEGESKNYDIRILSGDLDFLQLVSDHVQLVKFNGKIENSVFYGPKETEARLGVKVDQVVDYKAIIGDSSDNYKGIPGVGPKGAEKLLHEYKSLEGIYDHLQDLQPKLREKFETNQDYVFHCRKLAQLHFDVPHDFTFDSEFVLVPDTSSAFLEKMKFPSLISRYNRLLRDYEKPRKENLGETKLQKKLGGHDEQMSLF